MNTIKYLLFFMRCVVESWVGASGQDHSIKEGNLGIASWGVIVGVFCITLFILFKLNKREKISITSKVQLFVFGILITILVIVLICAILIVCEKILQ